MTLNQEKKDHVQRSSLGLILTGIAMLSAGCATSMTPSQFTESFPKATTSAYYSKASQSEAISNGKCRLLAEGRKYTAPIGFTAEGDLKNGARGVDEWVKADKGNAYTINNFEWITVPAGQYSATQLIVYFDTLACG